MKKILSAVLSICFILTLTSCGGDPSPSSSEEASSALASSSLHYTTDERFESVTKEVFESFIGKNLRNFTYTVTTADSFEALFEKSYLVNGAEHTYIREEYGRIEKTATKVNGSTKLYYSYDEDKGYWERVMYAYEEIDYPLSSLPYSFEDVSFDETTGLYYIVRDDLYDVLEPADLARGAAEVYFGFKDNECVFFRVYYGGRFCAFSEYRFSDYNSTVIDVSPINNTIGG